MKILRSYFSMIKNTALILGFLFIINPSIFVYADNTGIPNGGLCDTRVRKPVSISRMCTYTIDSAKINAFITQYPATESTLRNIADNPPSGNAPNFASTITTLRNLSYQYTGQHDSLYIFQAGSCKYIPTYASNDICTNDATTSPPLIDRVKPTISVDMGVGKREVTLESILNHEQGLSHTGYFLAGTGTIKITFTDAGTSNYTPSSVWQNFNGISGIRGYVITICRTKTHTGMVLNAGCGGTPTHQLYSSGALVTGAYNPQGSVTTAHTIIDTIDLSDTTSDGIQIAGEYQIYTALADVAGNITVGTANFVIYPEGVDRERTRLDKYDNGDDLTDENILYTTRGDTVGVDGAGISLPYFANAVDKQNYKLSIFDIYGNPVYGWNLYNFGLSDIGIYLDEVNKTGPSAIYLSTGSTTFNTKQTVATNGNGAVIFTTRAYTPGIYDEKFSFEYRVWDRFHREIGTNIAEVFPSVSHTGSFLHIMTGAIELQTTKRVDLGTENDIRFGFRTTTATTNPNIKTFTLHNFMESLVSLSPNDFTITNKETSYDPLYTFSPNYPRPGYLEGAVSRFTPEQVGRLFVGSLKIGTVPYITIPYADGPVAQYYVSPTVNLYGSGIIFGTGGLNRIYVEGNKRTTGKEGFVDITTSIGSTNSADARNTIHKNVALLLRNRPSIDIVNRVKYVVGDTTTQVLETDKDSWDTVIIKGGNLTINTDFNVQDDLSDVPHKGIIVLTNDEETKGGFIYIKPNVHFIGATLYADESLQSVGNDGKVAVYSNSARTSILDSQLVFYGGIFSKNTVGGAVKANDAGTYILPWKNTTTSLDEAVKFDLAFLRMDNKNMNTRLNLGHKEFVVIMSDSRNLSDPLPGFAKIQ